MFYTTVRFYHYETDPFVSVNS